MLVSCIVETGHTAPAWRHGYVSLWDQSWRFAQGSYKRWPLPPTAAHSSAYLAPVRKSFNQSHRPLGWLQPLWHLILLTTFSGSSPFLGTLPILFACFFYYLYLPFSGCCFSRFHCSLLCVCVWGGLLGVPLSMSVLASWVISFTSWLLLSPYW